MKMDADSEHQISVLDFPPLPELQNAEGRARAAKFIAPAVMAGSPINESVVQDAKMEMYVRQGLACKRWATLEEVAAAEERYHALYNELWASRRMSAIAEGRIPKAVHRTLREMSFTE